MKAFWQYLKYVCIHKWYVFVECKKLGIWWRGVTHDLSKFLPSEFFPYMNYFYGNRKDKKAFDYAWLLHQKRNKHHWQYWILVNDEDPIKVLQMDLNSVKEMLADWNAMSRKFKGNTSEWYKKHKDKIQLNELSKQALLWYLIMRNKNQ